MERKCGSCDYEWESRVEKPKQCPRCKDRCWEINRAETGGKCENCGRQFIMLCRHHIKPVSKGGKNTSDNIMYVCVRCHGHIHNKKKEKQK